MLGCSACCPSSLRQCIPARSIHVCSICSVPHRGMLPGDGMEGPWGRFLESPTTPLVTPKGPIPGESLERAENAASPLGFGLVGSQH